VQQPSSDPDGDVAVENERATAGLTDISRLDHAHVIPSVADTAHRLLGKLADQLRHIGFLGWRASARDDRWQLRSQEDKLCAEAIEAELSQINMGTRGPLACWRFETSSTHL
jgi:hypothetical protein